MNQALLLTARNIYLLINGKLPNFENKPFAAPEHLKGMTLTRFWYQFLQNTVPEEVLAPLFDTSARRKRALSVLMNRSETVSCPHALYDALEAGLTVDALLRLTAWWQGQLDPQADMWALHDLLNAYENACLEQDEQLTRLAGFIEYQRQRFSNETTFIDRQFFGCALRLAWLSLYAVYGGKMFGSATLLRLRQSREVDPDALWTRAYQAYAPPQTERYSFDTEPYRAPAAEHAVQPGAAQKVLDEVYSLLRSHCGVLSSKHQGWYAVANFTDPHISLNDMPKATYDGSRILALIPNGTILWIESATGYHGLRNSSGCWGYTQYNGISGYVPMNLLVKLFIEP